MSSQAHPHPESHACVSDLLHTRAHCYLFSSPARCFCTASQTISTMIGASSCSRPQEPGQDFPKRAPYTNQLESLSPDWLSQRHRAARHTSTTAAIARPYPPAISGTALNMLCYPLLKERAPHLSAFQRFYESACGTVYLLK